jgi:LacI family transcriptional regulator
MQKLLALANIPDGVFAVEDFTALGAMQTIKATGKNIPDDIAIIGFANEPFAEYITPALSTVNQHTVRMGEEAAKLFFEQLHGNGKNVRPRKVVLQPELVCRQSSDKKRAPEIKN